MYYLNDVERRQNAALVNGVQFHILLQIGLTFGAVGRVVMVTTKLFPPTLLDKHLTRFSHDRVSGKHIFNCLSNDCYLV